MQQIRYVGTMKLVTEDDRNAAPTLPALIFEAIVRQLCVSATYNRMKVLLAPHVIYTRNDALYVGAVTLLRDGQVPREEKMGAFKLDGLAGLALSEQAFEPRAIFEPEDERWAQSALMKIER